MKKKVRNRVTAGLVAAAAAAALGTAVYGAAAASKQQIRMEEEIAQLREELNEKEQRIQELEDRTADDLQVYLPDRLYVAEGRTLELYNSQVAFSGMPDEYSFNWVCDIGKNLERKYQVYGSEDQIGEHTLTLMVYNSRLEPVYEKDTVLEVTEASVRQPVKILNIGDSLSDSAPWYEEVASLAGGQITFVGTRGNEGLMHEGRSGFSICDYLTETEYVYGGEGVQPFYNPGTGGFDYSYYKEKTGVSPDVVQIFLGKNGMSLDYEPGIAWLEEMVNNIRETDPDIPISLVQTIYMGGQDGIGNETDAKGRSALNGWWKLEEDKKVFLWTEAMEAAFGSMDGVYLIPAALAFDSEYNFRASIEPVNARSSRNEAVLMEGMHPDTEGYLQLADLFFSTYCGTMK